MRLRLLLILFTMTLSMANDVLAEAPLRKAVECSPRGGLSNFLKKVNAGQTVKVAYLGGSITAAPGWRVQSREWLQQQYPQSTIEEVHAAIGGTGSDLGVFRLQRDVLQHQPDMLFVEFAVNDGSASTERIHKAMEGIVRQTWQADSMIDICYVYTLKEDMLADLQAGNMPHAASAMEALADHYAIPSIHFGVEVAKLEAEGELIFSAPKPKDDADATPLVFSTDGVHPHIETGHRLYVEAIARSWPMIENASNSPAPHPLPKPLRTDNWERAQIVEIRPEMLSGDWEQLGSDHSLARRFQRNMPELFQARSAGAKLSFQFEGTTAAIFDLVGPDGGELSVTLDQAEPVKRNRIDGYCTYHRMSKLNIATELPFGVHTVEIMLTPTELNKQQILFERNRADMEANPDKYAPHTWYPAAIMLIGELK